MFQDINNKGAIKKTMIDSLFHKSNNFCFMDYALPIKKVIVHWKKMTQTHISEKKVEK